MSGSEFAKRRSLVAFVEITTRPSERTKRTRTLLPPETEEPTSPRKRIRANERIASADAESPSRVTRERSPLISCPPVFEQDSRHGVSRTRSGKTRRPRTPSPIPASTHSTTPDTSYQGDDVHFDVPAASSSRTSKSNRAQSDTPNPSIVQAHPPDSSHPDDSVYTEADDEYLEDANLIMGEVLPDVTSSNMQSDLPVRVLEDFTIYIRPFNRVCFPLELMELNYTKTKTIYGASGLVRPFVQNAGEDEDWEDDLGIDDRQRVKLSNIFELNIHHFDGDNLDWKIYIRTEFAWYILTRPSINYATYFNHFWIQHYICNSLVYTALARPEITYEEFIECLNNPIDDQTAPTAIQVVGRLLTRADVESPDVQPYLIATLSELAIQYGIYIGHTELARVMLGEFAQSLVRSKGRQRQYRSQKSQTRPPNLEKTVLKAERHTVVTSLVKRIAQNLFDRTLKAVGDAVDVPGDDDVVEDMRAVRKAHNDDPKSMVWGETIFPGYYSSVIIDGENYQVGDVVMVNPGEDENVTRAGNAKSDGAQSTNALANRVWFCRICYFFESQGVKQFHGQWFQHGSKTLLQEVAHTKSLYVLNKCDDNPIATIFKKCNVKMLSADDEEPPDDGGATENNFYCSLVWDEEHVSFTDLPNALDFQRVFQACADHMPCYSCGLESLAKGSDLLRRIPNGYCHHGICYHIGDFVLVNQTALDGDLLLLIAQVTKITGIAEKPQVSVQYFGRYPEQQHTEHKSKTIVFSDNRRLYLSTRTGVVDVDKITGHCYVRYLIEQAEIEDWVQDGDCLNFYVNEKCAEDDEDELQPMGSDELAQCKVCYEERLSNLGQEANLVRQNAPLRGLELFAGAGGLGAGLALSGFVEPKYAIELSPSAAATYQLNHKDSIVYNQDSNTLLQHAIDAYEGRNPEPLESEDGQTILKPMPKPGDVDIITGGLPCQCFSGANHSKSPDDVRAPLMCNMISYAAWYKPDYFLLENVVGLLTYPLMSTLSADGRRMEGGIRHGAVKAIVHMLISIGYQVHYKVLQAGQYGAPQSRCRVIFWAARRGLTLPPFPLPTHAFPGGSWWYKLPIGGKMPPVTRACAPGDFHQGAQLPPVTVDDAIGDLPPFDWINPHVALAETPRERREAAARAARGITQCPAAHAAPQYPGFPAPVAYAHAPRTRFQAAMRAGGAESVGAHYTGRFNAATVERTVLVPLVPGADHTALPRALQPRRFWNKGVVPKGQRALRRIDGAGHFKTAMTQVHPETKAVQLLHPSQKRVVSVRECARAQGFPDSYVFVSSNTAPRAVVEDQYRQIGNAVPVPLALALGRGLGVALLRRWREEARAESPVV